MKKLFKKFSIKQQLLIPSILGFLAFGSILSYMQYSSQEREMINSAKEEATANLFRVSGLVKSKMDEAISVARTVANTLASTRVDGKSTISRENVIAIMKKQIKENPVLLGTGTLWERNSFDGLDDENKNAEFHDATGRFIPYVSRGKEGAINVEPLIDYEVPGAGDYNLKAKNLRKEVVIDPYVYPIGGVDTLITTLTVPIIENGKYIGMVCVDISLQFLQNISDNTEIFNGFGKLGIYSNQGFIAGLTGHSDLVNKVIFNTELANYSGMSKTRFSNKIDSVIDDNNLSLVSPFSPGRTNENWYVEVLIPTEVIYEPIIAQGINNAMILVGLLVFFLIGQYWVVRSTDNSLRVSYNILKEAASSTENSSHVLVKESQVLAAATVENAAATQESVASISEISAMVKLTKERALESTDSLEYISSLTDEGVERIKELNRSMEQIEKASDNLSNFSNVIKKIEEKTQIINDIVFKTQLLSFNASIEAARAGHNGKGFAVVAEEVGNLAELSGKAAQDISSALGESSKGAIEGVNFTKNAISEGTEVSSKVTESFEKIYTSMNEVAANIKNISEATNEQVVGLNEVEGAMKTLDEASQMSSKANEKFNFLAEQSKEDAERITEVSILLSNIMNGTDSEQNTLGKVNNVVNMHQHKNTNIDEMYDNEDIDYSSFK